MRAVLNVSLYSWTASGEGRLSPSVSPASVCGKERDCSKLRVIDLDLSPQAS
jgi:hypothetical protein